MTVSPKVGGYVERVLVADNQPVGRGQLLAVLDPRDYRANVEQAQAQIAAAGANITTARRTLDEQQATVAQGRRPGCERRGCRRSGRERGKTLRTPYSDRSGIA